jgi:hypothetical protein
MVSRASRRSSQVLRARSPHSLQDSHGRRVELRLRIHVATFFDDALIDTINAQQPYAAKRSRNVRNAVDSIYDQGGTQVLMALNKTTTGYAGAFNIALQM